MALYFFTSAEEEDAGGKEGLCLIWLLCLSGVLIPGKLVFVCYVCFVLAEWKSELTFKSLGLNKVRICFCLSAVIFCTFHLLKLLLRPHTV